MQLPEGKRLWALIGTFVGAILTFAAASWVVFVTTTAQNGRIPNVPVANTELAFQGMNDAAWLQVKPLLPSLVLPSPSPVDGALVILPDGKKEWIVMDPLTHRPQGSQAALALIGSSKTSIRNELVLRTAPAETPWIVMSRSVLPLTGQFSRIDLGQSPSFSWVSADLEDRLEGALITQGLNDLVFVRDTEPVFTTLMKFMESEKKTVMQSLLRTAIANRFGNDISAEFEILPLFTQSLTIWRGTENGLLLYGQSDVSVSDEVIASLHTHAAEGVTGTKRLQAETKEGFTVDVLQKDSALTARIDRVESGWKISETASGETPVLLTAVRGKNVIITNNRTFLATALATSELTTGAIAKGMLSPESVTSLRALLPAALLEKLLLLTNQSQPLGFELTEQNSIWTLTF